MACLQALSDWDKWIFPNEEVASDKIKFLELDV